MPGSFVIPKPVYRRILFMTRKTPEYEGFEQGPIRPPSEAYSLLIRVTRNCPWNRCRFCYVYKDRKFSIRPVEHVKRDIDLVHRFVESLKRSANATGRLYREDISHLAREIDPEDIEAFNAAIHWMASGMRSVFIQDANSLVIRPAYLIDILRHLKKRFPWVDRITSYARSHSLARIKDDDFQEIRQAGLNRIHVGLESGSDRVLALVNKGVDKEKHVMAGRKVLAAGIELSEYVMPGLGGKRLAEEHALETADALNRIDPHFIRLRTLVIPEDYPLFGDDPEIPFEKSTDRLIAAEIRTFIAHLEGITSTVKSDHMNNLLQMIEGKLPEDKNRMLDLIDAFLALDVTDQVRFQVGRRFGFMVDMADLNKPDKKGKADAICRQLGITAENVDSVIDRTVTRTL